MKWRIARRDLMIYERNHFASRFMIIARCWPSNFEVAQTKSTKSISYCRQRSARLRQGNLPLTALQFNRSVSIEAAERASERATQGDARHCSPLCEPPQRALLLSWHWQPPSESTSAPSSPRQMTSQSVSNNLLRQALAIALLLGLSTPMMLN